MSFARFVLRTATVKALRGRTFAGDLVRDSEVGPIDDAATVNELPFVVVYTDDVDVLGGGTDLCTNDGSHSLVIEIGVTTRAKPRGEWVIPTTDAGMELTIDAIERQIQLALGNPSSAWAELWRDLVMTIEGRKSQRGASSKDGVRFAGRQVIFELKLPRDPTPGTPIVALWQRFLTLAAADPDLAGMVPLLTQLATGEGAAWPDWKSIRASYGLSAARAEAMKIGPVPSIAPDVPDFAEAPALHTDADAP